MSGAPGRTLAGTRRLGAVLVLAALLLAGGCRRGGTNTPPASEDAAVLGGLQVPGGFGGAAREPKPIYPPLVGAPDPLAVRVCRLLHGLREERRAACCDGSRGTDLGELCTDTLTVALRGKALEISSVAVDACEAALVKTYAGCDWVGPLPPAIPSACQRLVTGTQGEAMPCRSTLECSGNLHCHGLGPTRVGSCGPARGTGAACDQGADPLASALRQDDIDREHPECEGACYHHRCIAPVPVGGDCVSRAQCGGGSHCGDGHCRRGEFAEAGQACASGGCAPFLRCVQGLCLAPRPSGTPCQSDFECRGACLRTDGGAGRCGMDCKRR